MNKNGSRMASLGPPRPPEFHRRFRQPGSSRPLPNRASDFAPNRRFQAQTSLPRPNFVIQLSREKSGGAGAGAGDGDVEALIGQCELPRPESFKVFHSGAVAGSISYMRWNDARDAVVRLWEFRLAGVHGLVPKLTSAVSVSSDAMELEDCLREAFAGHVRGLMEGEEVRRWREKRDRVAADIAKVSELLGKPRDLRSFSELSDRKTRLCRESELVEKRVREFNSAMNCFLCYLEGRSLEEFGGDCLEVIRLGGKFNWTLIHSLMSRERRRLEDGLPIYAYRQEILQQIHSQQIMVLIGETGSGKSTQLVQFLADSGIAADEAIVCTQPRKIAATSLAHRVKDESSGCYRDDSITSYPTFSSFQKFDSKVIFTTDHCLLQHYMSDNNMSRISCIIVDEAHERSLNTDLLLALVKSLLSKRFDLRLVIMSATADAQQLSDYFFGCGIFHVVGRNFPVDISYVPCDTAGTSANASSYVRDVVRKAREIHGTEEEGAVLAFLTSQNEVEWACENFDVPDAVALPLHGKLSFEEQFHVFQKYPGKRKIIFATNLAETSLTIPGVKYVIDSGMVKESKYEPASGMNVLRVCCISQSSANQRAGRAGRTEPGKCYRLYSESDFEIMPTSQEPEIRRVHLGVAVLRIFALGIKNVQDFDFVDAPSAEAIDMAVRNLVQLRAVKQQKEGEFKLTDEGLWLVKMGIEPRLGKLILGCLNNHMRREGLVLAAVMANASSIFFRVGTDEEKLKSDCLKVNFCHQDGDLFTLLSVYKEWEAVPGDKKSKWCLENSINGKTMRRCHDTVLEMESCLERELNVVVPTYWLWSPTKSTDFDLSLKRVILSSLTENVAMHSGNDQLGYEVALTGQHVQLHPSCSLLIYSQKPSWVVFSELLSITCQYLVCVSSIDFDFLSTLYPPPLFDASRMVGRKLQQDVLTGFGGTVLKRFCGKSNNNLLCLVSRIREQCKDDRVSIKVSIEHNEITLFATSVDMERVKEMVNDSLEFERRWVQNECVEKCLYQGSGVPSVALYGAGAEIKHLELQKRCLSVDLYCSNVSSMSVMEEKELLLFIEKISSGTICSFHKFTPMSQKSDEMEKWGRITFLSPGSAQQAGELNEVEYKGSSLKVIPSQPAFEDHKNSSFPAVKARVQWPRRLSRGFAVVKCDTRDVALLVNDFSHLVIGGKYVNCEACRRSADAVFISGLDKELSESEVSDALRSATRRRILDFFLVRGEAVENPPSVSCGEALFKEIAPFMPKTTQNSCRVQVFPPEPKDVFVKALITFDGRLHLEAAKALEQIDGKVLPGCKSWQKIRCQQLFYTTLSCSVPVYIVIKKQLDSLMRSFTNMQGVECSLDRNTNGSYRIKISANATRTIAQLRSRVEVVVKGKTVENRSLTPTVLQHLFSRDGINLLQSLQRETGTHIFFDRHSISVRVFGSPDQIAIAQQKLIDSLLSLHESKQLEIHLRGKSLPPNLLKEVVRNFGADLCGLKDKVPEADFTLNIRRHVILMQGDIELKPQVENIVYNITQNKAGSLETLDNEVTCPICLCDIEDAYQLEGCAHRFCRFCLQEQCDSAIRNNQDSFPLCCAHQDCGSPILITDLRSLLSTEKIEELFRASLGAFVASSGGTYRFCPSPDCPSVYRVADPGTTGEPFVCGSCYVDTCTSCHLEYHPYLSCDKYREFKEDPDLSLKEWRSGRDNVKNCPICGQTIEKVDGCNHIECRCGKHICWVCLEVYRSSDECYSHLRNLHMAII